MRCGVRHYDASVSRLFVAAFAAVSALASVAVSYVRGFLAPFMMACTTLAAGIAAWSAMEPSKKTSG
jgi:hypothetical protein